MVFLPGIGSEDDKSNEQEVVIMCYTDPSFVKPTAAHFRLTKAKEKGVQFGPCAGTLGFNTTNEVVCE